VVPPSSESDRLARAGVRFFLAGGAGAAVGAVVGAASAAATCAGRPGSAGDGSASVASEEPVGESAAATAEWEAPSPGRPSSGLAAGATARTMAPPTIQASTHMSFMLGILALNRSAPLLECSPLSLFPVQKSWMHAFLQNRKFAIFAKRTTGMAAGYFTKVKEAGLFEMDFSRSKFGDDRPHGGNHEAVCK
jgi:hypothetical protein